MTRFLSPETAIVQAGFIGAEAGDPHCFIQWKGTDVCMDFHCDCGAHCHFDGDFAYTVRCPHCGAVWEMPCIVYPRRVGPATHGYWGDNPKQLEPDEEHCDDQGTPAPVSR